MSATASYELTDNIKLLSTLTTLICLLAAEFPHVSLTEAIKHNIINEITLAILMHTDLSLVN